MYGKHCFYIIRIYLKSALQTNGEQKYNLELYNYIIVSLGVPPQRSHHIPLGSVLK